MTSYLRIGSASRRAAVRVAMTTFLLAAVVALSPASGRAGSVTVFATVDENFTDPTGTGVFTTMSTPTNGLDIRDFAGAFPNFQHLSVVNFFLGSLPSNAVIQDVTFNYDANSVTSNTGRTVGLFGYAASGSFSLADATASATLLASYDNYALGLGQHSVDLGSAGVSLLDSLVAQGKSLNLRIQGTTFGTNTAIISIEESIAVPQSGPAPTLTVTFSPAVAAPAPSGLVLAGIGALLVLGCSWYGRRRAALPQFGFATR